MNKCIGCGVKLQNKNELDIGYTNNLDNKYCARCFKTIHYNMNIEIYNVDNLDIINKINKLSFFTIFIIDLLSLNNLVIDNYNLINNKKILIINKCDIIPDNLKLEHLEENIQKVYNIKENIFFISAKKDYYLNKVIELIKENKNVIFCGETSSGKSTLINSLTNKGLTTSKYNNTTLDFIKIKINDYTIYDSPGLIINPNKKSIDNIIMYTKKLSNDYVLNINDLKLKGTGNITLLLDKNIIIKSKKEDIKLNYEIDVNNKDIILDNGFIYVKKGIIKSNKKLNIRDSIIK